VSGINWSRQRRLARKDPETYDARPIITLSKFGGAECDRCGSSIERGEPIKLLFDKGIRHWVHANCPSLRERRQRRGVS
jgi:hypothetical protein